MTVHLGTLLLGFSLMILAAGCENRSGTVAGPGGPRSPAAAHPSIAAQVAGGQPPSAVQVTRVVFIGMERACDCTRRRIDAGWAALQQALGSAMKVPVERLQADTQEDRVASYRKQRPFVALPAIYFVEGTDRVLGLLQGEVTADQIAGAIATGTTP